MKKVSRPRPLVPWKCMHVVLRHWIIERVGDDVLTPDNAKWREFAERLTAAIDRGKCDHTHKKTKRLLRQLRFDVGRSVRYFVQHGGFCDCEVIWNVARSVQRRGRDKRPGRQAR